MAERVLVALLMMMIPGEEIVVCAAVVELLEPYHRQERTETPQPRDFGPSRFFEVPPYASHTPVVQHC
jgi:hypothetical protein